MERWPEEPATEHVIVGGGLAGGRELVRRSSRSNGAARFVDEATA